jgi:GAF domain-containing protein
VIAVDDAAEQRRRWPSFAPEISSLGFGAVYAVPMRLRESILGAFNLFCRPGAPLSVADLNLAQALSDVATIAIMQHRTISAQRQVAEQLQIALNSRIAIEQAKGAIAERAQIDMDAAFQLLRGYARHTQSRLPIVAAAIASGRLSPAIVLDAPPAPDTQ